MSECKNYIEFVNAYRSYKITRELRPDLILDLKVSGEEFMANFDHGLPNCHIFNIDDKLKKALLLTKTPDKNSHINLPFDYIFLDVDFKVKELVDLGLKFSEKELDQIIGILVTKGDLVLGDVDNRVVEPWQNLKQGLVVGKALRMSTFSKWGKEVWFDTFNDGLDFDLNFDLKKHYKLIRSSNSPLTARTKKLVHLFTLNFLNLINNPEVTYIDVYRTDKNLQKRLKKGKIGLPPSHNIRLTGFLKYYMDTLEHREYSKYNYRFWVRGHFRTLTSEKFRFKKGTRVWIPPYIKGEGLLVKKFYTMEETK